MAGGANDEGGEPDGDHALGCFPQVLTGSVGKAMKAPLVEDVLPEDFGIGAQFHFAKEEVISIRRDEIDVALVRPNPAMNKQSVSPPEQMMGNNTFRPKSTSVNIRSFWKSPWRDGAEKKEARQTVWTPV